MAEVTTQPAPSSPWDKVRIQQEQKTNRDAQRLSYQQQHSQIVNEQTRALQQFDEQYSQQTRGGIVNPEQYQSAKKMAMEPYQQQIGTLEAKISALDQADKGLMPDGSPIRPEYFSLIDPKTGMLYDQYQIKVDKYDAKNLDPTSLAGMEALKKEALRSGPSAWAKLMQQTEEMKRMSDLEKAVRQANSGTAQARGQLAMRGGLSSGARERIATQGSRDLMGARQGLNRDFNSRNIQLLSDDEKNRLSNLNTYSGMETDLGKYNTGITNDASRYNLETKAKQDEFNIMRALEEKRASDVQDLDVYKEQQKKWAAERQAQATERSGGGGGGGCCFIFLEARYGNGTMDKVVRKFRDEHMTERNVRGYHKLSEVLVPLMRKSKIAKFLVRVLMTDPMVSYGNYYYGRNYLGWVFKPVTKFWLGVFDYLGLEHKYIRENGETV